MDNKGVSMEAFLEAQKAYWQKLMAGGDVPSNADWADFISKSQQQAFQEAPKQFSQLLDILGAQSSNFTAYGEELLKLYRSGNEQHLSAAVEAFSKYMQKQTAETLIQQWQLPEQFASLFKSHSFRDDLMFENPFISGIKSLLETPIIGGSREYQEQIREVNKLIIEYQEALKDYVAHYASINQSAETKMLQKLTDPEIKVRSLQQLHDIWVDAYESAYSDTVFTDAYQRAHGRISNALMRLRKFAQDVRDVHLQSAGLATRKGLDTALQRQHILRKEMRTQRHEVQNIKDQLEQYQTTLTLELVNELKQEIAALKAEVATLKKQQKVTNP